VVGDEGALLGVISEADLMAAIAESVLVARPGPARGRRVS
jgi:CBS domain-containing protein